jgi:hypothetical protein
MKSRIALASIVLAASAFMGISASQATTVFSDNFNATNGGATALNYSAFGDFTVPTGQVDLVATPNNFGITCAGGSGSCVDLDGTPGPGSMQTTLVSFGAGQLVTLSFELAQDQRDAAPNNVFASIDFTGATNIATSSFGGGFGSSSGPTGSQTSIGTTTVVTNPNFTLYTMSFTSTQAGSFTALIGTNDKGYIGALLDNVTIDVSAIPEPGTWAMLLVGFFGIGSMVRLAGSRKLGEASV